MYTNGLKDRFGSPLASKRDVEKQITGQIYNKVEHESLSLSNASNEAEVNCIAIKSAYLQHNKEFTEFSILPKDSNTDTPLYMYALLEQNQAKTVIGLSDEAITWEAGTEAVWKFTNNPITIPDGKNIEMFMITGQSAIPSSGDPTAPGRHIKIHCNSNMSGAGSTRYNTGWTMNRLVYCKFIEKSGNLISKTHADETYLTEESANNIYISQDDESVVKKNYIRESYDLEYCTDTAEVNGISLSSLYIPHNRTINKVSVLAKDMNLDTPLYLYVYTAKNGAKTRVGLSDAAILWTTDELVTWTFNQNPITIPDGANIEMYLVENEDAAAGLDEPNYPSRHIKIACKNNETNAGGTRYWDKWSMNRVVYCFFTDADYKYIENETVKDTYLTKTEAHLKFATKEENKPYDWTPDWVHAIQSTNTADYTAPTNGWISTTQGAISGDVTINGQLAGYNTTSGSYTMLLREGDQIHFTGGSNFLFAPCNAEQEDWREVKTNYDIWKNAIRYDDNGTPYVQNLWIPVAAEWAENIRIPHNLTITKVEDEKAYNGDTFVCNIQSTEIENATFLFYGFNVNGVDTVCPIQTWDSDLNKLLSGGYMFCRSNLSSFSGNLDSMTRGYQMFYNSRLASFNTPMPSVVNGYLMFATDALTNFNVEELPNLSNGEAMFAYTNISSFTTDMPKLSNAREMFMSTPSLTTFDADLSNLKTGWKMFGDGDSALAKLSDESFQNIASSIKDINGMVRNDDSLWKYDTVDTYGTVKPNAGTIGYDYRGIIHLNSQDGHGDSAIVTQAMETIVSKGWIAYLNGSVYQSSGEIVVPTGPNDVSVANGYIPNASAWGSNVRQAKNLVIVRVENGVAYSE